MTFLIKAAQLILALSILVFVHELGHFGFARLFKVRVNKFYLFFNPKFSIVRFKKIGGKWRARWFAPNVPESTKPKLDAQGDVVTNAKGKTVFEPLTEAELAALPDDDWRRYPESTEWGIGWLPLGGYCSIDGMVDETTDSAQLTSQPKPWEYRSRPAWQRLFIITGGVLMNFVAAIVIYAAMLGHWGKSELPMQNAYLGYDYCEIAQKYGFTNGDIILTVDGDSVKFARDAIEKILVEGKQNVLLRHNGADTLIVLPADFAQQLLAAEETNFLELRIPFVVQEAVPHSPADSIGLSDGDSIVGLNGKPLCTYSEISRELAALAGQRTDITFVRNGETITDSIVVDADGKLGIYLRSNLGAYFELERTEYGFFASIPAGWEMMCDVLDSYVKQFRLVFTKEGAKSLGGFGAIGNLFPAMWDWATFWNMTAFLSVILAFMNILPIPVLDGGYVLFLLYEMIFRRKPSDKFMEISLNIGFALLLALLIYANGNDIYKLLLK